MDDKKEEPITKQDEEMESEDDEDEEEENRLLAKVRELNAILSSNPYDYQSHVDLVNLLGQLGELDQLRAAREHFAKCYPLTPELWLAWISDEQKLAGSKQEKETVYSLFDRAVKDYLSVELWLEYCQYRISEIDTTEGVAKARETFERAVVACGVHLAKGAIIWEAYRELELALMEQKEQQKDKVDKLFKRQLNIPLLDMQSTYEEYVQFLDGAHIDPNTERQYKAALEMLEAREHLETSLTTSSCVETYQQYVNLELHEGNPVRIQNIYERFLTDHCLNDSVWLEYTKYLENKLKICQVSCGTFERAVRNCPWNSSLWVAYLRALERHQCPKEDLLKVVEQALTAGFNDPTHYRNVWLAYIDYTRRSIEDFRQEKSQDILRNLFNRALNHLNPLLGDPECKIARYWASVEADRLHCMEEARKMWAQILFQNELVCNKAQYWLEYVQLEKLYGDTKHLRKLFHRALEKTTDAPEIIGETWIQFEREEGTLSQYEEAEFKIGEKMKQVQVYRREEMKRSEEKQEKKKEKDKEKRREKRHQEADSRKRVRQQDHNKDDEPVFKKPNLPMANSNEKAQEFVKPPPGFKVDAAPPGFKESKCENNDDDQRLLTVFLSNLDFGVTEDQIKDVMGKSGPVKEVRLVKNYAGKSKGFGFVEFETMAAAQNALGRDHELLDGRPMFVSQCDPEKRAEFKYSTALEKNKLFVKGLPKSTTKEDLEQLYGQYGVLKEVRLVTYRNGHSKGLAFVEFQEEPAAAKALVKTDESVIDGHTICVAISNPPARKSEPPPPKLTRSLGSTSKEASSGPRGRGRTQVALVPRSVQAKKESSNGTSTSKSNADFRNMLLGKK